MIIIRFSIIIPVYQAQKYLHQCLDSIIKQNFTDYELILIDDGSKDNSGKICDDYTKKFINAKVIHQPNSGPSAARNKGIEQARGDYIIFIDADDYIATESLEQINQELKKSHFPDLLITPFQSFTKSGENHYYDLFLQKYDIYSMNKEEVIELLFNHSEGICYAWRYIVKKKLIENYQIRFPVGMIYEDNEWTPRIFLFADSFSGLKYYWYYYRKDNKASITNNIRFQNTMDQIKILTLNIQYISEKCDNHTIIKSITQRFSKEILNVLLLRYPHLTIKNRRKIVVFIKKHKNTFKKNNSFKFFLFFSCTNIFGLNLNLKLYRMLIKLKKKLGGK